MVLWDETSQMALDSEKIVHKGKVQAMNYTNEANQYNFQAQNALFMGEMQAEGTRTSGMISGISGAARGLVGAFGG
jgi:hypothetical protein